MQELKINGIYKHFKGDYYLVEGIAKNSETQCPVNVSHINSSLLSSEHIITQAVRFCECLISGICHRQLLPCIIHLLFLP